MCDGEVKVLICRNIRAKITFVYIKIGSRYWLHE